MGDTRTLSATLETFIERSRRLTDEDRLRLAEARAAIDETFHAGAWKAANDIVVQRAWEYRHALVNIGAAFVPGRLEELVQAGTAADRTDVGRWQDVARHARLAIEDALLALVAADLLRPPDLRELYGPWKAMLEAAHEQTTPRPR
ncbi:MAG TPA: hypothetical protein VFZ37_16855 [Jiangellaceae bacterium]